MSDLTERARLIVENGGLIAKDRALSIINYAESAERKIDQLISDLNQTKAELARRDAAAGEPVKAVAKHYTGCKYPLVKINGLEFIVAGSREDAEEIAEELSKLYTVTPPAPSAPDGWIKCSDRIPEECEPVIVVDDGIDVYPAVFSGGMFYEYGDTITPCLISNPTHWTPLPAAPGGE